MGPCPRCGMRLLPGALRCVNCDLEVAPTPAPAPAAEPGSAEGAAPPPYAAPAGTGYSPYAPTPTGWPPYGGPQPAYPQGGYYPVGPTPWSTNGMAVASLILGIIWLGGIGSLLAVIFGHVGRSQIKKRPQRGSGLALAGLIVGYVGVVLSVVFWASIPRIINSGTVQNIFVQQDISSAADAEHEYFSTTGTFTNEIHDLNDDGFSPVGHDTIQVAYRGATGFCLVGAHDGSNTWYLYDTNRGDLTDTTYSSADAAQADCSVTGARNWTTIN